MNARARWVAAYLDSLPASMRLNENDSRYADPARRAAENGWTPDALGAAVAFKVGAHSPSSPANYALPVMSQLADGAPIDLRPIASPELEEWRARLPRTCSHKDARRLGLTPNQCKPCRRIAGDPALVGDGPNGPGVCPTCWVPGCDRHLEPVTPLEHVTQRRQLLTELATIPVADMGPDEREQAMAVLIAHQRGEVTTR